MSDLERVDAIVSGDIAIRGLRAKSIERLRRRLALKNPDFVRARRSGDTGSIKEWIDVLFEEPSGDVRVPRGTTQVIRETLAEDLIRPRYIDQRVTGAPLAIDDRAFDRARHEKPPRYYQMDVAYEAEQSLQGTIVIPCAGGKTTAGALAIERVRRSTLVLVHTEDLLDQWVETIRFWLGLEAGRVISGKASPAPVTVAMVITLANLLESSEGDAFAQRFGMVLVDEAHHAPAPETFQRALRKLPARVRIGLTATPDREDGLTDLMDWTFGRRLVEVDANTLFAKGWLTPPSIEYLPSEFRFVHMRRCLTCKTPFQGAQLCEATGKTRRCDAGKPHAKDENKRLAKLRKAITTDAARNALIADRVAAEWRAGETILVLSNHREHCRTLGRLCWERGAEAVVLVAKKTKDGREYRRESLDGMRAGRVRLVIATSLADEGLDIARLSRVVLALPERSKRGTSQRLGRLMRNWPGKRPKLIDVTDPHVETLVNRAEGRTRVYRSLGLVY